MVTGSTWPGTGSRPRRASSCARPRSWSASARSSKPRIGPAAVMPQYAAAGYSCSSPLRLFEHSYYGGRQLLFFDRGYWQNLTDYGFNDQLSSYIVGACSHVPGRAHQRRGRLLPRADAGPGRACRMADLRLGQPHLLPLHGLGLLRTRLPQRSRPAGNVKRPASEPAASAFRLDQFRRSRKHGPMDDEGTDRFRQIYEAHYGAVSAYARRRLPDGDLAQDAVSETFLVAWRRLADVPTGPDTLPWLYGVARRVHRQPTPGQPAPGRPVVPAGPGVAPGPGRRRRCYLRRRAPDGAVGPGPAAGGRPGDPAPERSGRSCPTGRSGWWWGAPRRPWPSVCTGPGTGWARKSRKVCPDPDTSVVRSPLSNTERRLVTTERDR